MKMRSLKVNAFLNFVKQLMTIVFPLVSFPYVSRILGSSEFGKYNIALSLVNYFSLFALFGITNYGIREGARIREDREAISQFASQMFSVNLITTIISYIILFITISLSQKFHSYSTLIIVQSSCLIMNLLGQDWLNTVFEDFLYITLRYIVIQVIALLAIFSFVRNEQDTIIYCLIMVLASYGGNIINLFYIRKHVKVGFTWNIPFQKITLPLLILFINSLAVIIYVNSDITILGFFESDAIVGIYSFSSKLYNIIKQLINAAVIVFVPRLTTYYISDKQKYSRTISAILNLLILFIIPIAMGIFVLSRQLIWIAGGRAYLDGSGTLSILSVSMIFALISSIYTNCVLIISRNEKKVLSSTLISASINVVGNFILIPQIGMLGAAVTTVVAELINLILQRHYAITFVIKEKMINRLIVVLAFSGGVITLLVSGLVVKIVATNSVQSSIIVIVISIVTSILLYIFILILFREHLIKILKI